MQMSSHGYKLIKVRSYNGHYPGLSIQRRGFDSPTHRQVSAYSSSRRCGGVYGAIRQSTQREIRGLELTIQCRSAVRYRRWTPKFKWAVSIGGITSALHVENKSSSLLRSTILFRYSVEEGRVALSR